MAGANQPIKVAIIRFAPQAYFQVAVKLGEIIGVHAPPHHVDRVGFVEIRRESPVDVLITNDLIFLDIPNERRRFGGRGVRRSGS